MDKWLESRLEIMVLGDKSWKLFIGHSELDWYLVSDGWEKVPLNDSEYSYLKHDVNIYLNFDKGSVFNKYLIEAAMWHLSVSKNLTKCQLAKEIVEGFIKS